MGFFYRWDEEKNSKLKQERGVSFQEVVLCMESNKALIITRPNTEKYAHQKMLVVRIRDYIYLVPFVESGDEVFLKTIIPSRKWTKRHLEEGGT